jgi:tRNA/rRNA methyltransferase
MPTDSLLDNFRVVLVEPAESLNIGSVARAMLNLGFRDLHLVAPKHYSRDRAKITACWAEHLIDSLHIHPTFAEALDGMEEVVALSLRAGKNPAHFVTLPQWVGELPERGLRKTALVFGPEDNGLRQEHLEYCQYSIRIPSADDCPTFNLAQSALLVLYEITKTFPRDQPAKVAQDLPTANDFVQLDRLLDSAMRESGFVRPGTPAPTPGVVHNLFRRMSLNKQEMGIVLSFVGRVSTALRRGNAPEGGED